MEITLRLVSNITPKPYNIFYFIFLVSLIFLRNIVAVIGFFSSSILPNLNLIYLGKICDIVHSTLFINDINYNKIGLK